MSPFLSSPSSWVQSVYSGQKRGTTQHHVAVTGRTQSDPSHCSHGEPERGRMLPTYTVNWPRTDMIASRDSCQKKVQVEQTPNLPDFHGLQRDFRDFQHRAVWTSCELTKSNILTSCREPAGKSRPGGGGPMRAELLAFGGVETVKKMLVPLLTSCTHLTVFASYTS